MARHVAAYFETETDAENAVSALRANGVPDTQITVLGKHGLEEVPQYAGAEVGMPLGDVAKGAGKGLLAGAGIGALAGLGGLLFPPLLPFVAIGWLAPIAGLSLTGAAAGAIVGGAVGTVAGILDEAKFEPQEAQFYANELERGGALVAVDLEGGISETSTREVFARFGGRYAPEASGTATL